MKAPWFPFYTGDFLASPTVQDMEAHEVGAYVLLLARSWQSDMPGYIEDDEYGMRKAARLSADAWAEAKTGLLKKWPVAVDKPGYRYNPRLLAEADKQVELREKKAEAGRRSAAKREAEANKRATDTQQKSNTCSTSVEYTATDVAQKGNYSQPQPQSTKVDVVPAATTPLPAKKTPKELAEMQASDNDLFTAETIPMLNDARLFNIVLTRYGFEHIDQEFYRKQIRGTMAAKNMNAGVPQFESFIKTYLNNEAASKTGLVLPKPREVKSQPFDKDNLFYGTVQEPMQPYTSNASGKYSGSIH